MPVSPLALPLSLALLASPPRADVDAAALLRAGLGPEALAAAGLTAAEAGQLVAAVAACDAAAGGDLAAADAAFRDAMAVRNACAQLVRSGNATDEQKADYQAAKAAAEKAAAARDAVLDELFAAGVADLAPAKQVKLARIRANRDRRGLPTELLVVERAPGEWLELRQGLQHEKVCLQDGEPVHPAVAAKLAAWRADPDVATAKADLDANLAAVTSAWKEALQAQ